MSFTRAEQARYESLLQSSTDAIALFRKQYRLFRSLPGIQRTITDGELMAACAFRVHEQYVFSLLFEKYKDVASTNTMRGRLPVNGGRFKGNRRVKSNLSNLL
jgi:hypothetical protein